MVLLMFLYQEWVEFFEYQPSCCNFAKRIKLALFLLQLCRMLNFRRCPKLNVRLFHNSAMFEKYDLIVVLKDYHLRR